MEFFFPADVFSAYPAQGPSARRSPYAPGPSSNIFNGCGFDSHPFFADAFADAIQHERAAYARAQAQRAAARAEADRRARAQAAAARREAEERQAQAFLQRILAMQQREAQRRYQLDQLHRQRQEAQRRQQYEEYQRRKAYAVEKERQRIAAAKAAEHENQHVYLALEDLLLGGLNTFFRAHLQDDEDDDDEVELTHKNDPASASAQPVDVKGKAKDNDDDNNTTDDAVAAAAAALNMEDDEDPAEVGPAPSVTGEDGHATETVPNQAPVTKTEQLVFTHAFPADSTFDKASIRADQINVSVDESQRKVTVSGLWSNEPATPTTVGSASPARSASPALSDSSSRRGRSRSPKRARVSDVDENGEEIVKPETNEDGDDDDFVEVNFVPAAQAHKTVERTFQLPEGANAEDLRAELSNEGLKLFTSVYA